MKRKKTIWFTDEDVKSTNVVLRLADNVGSMFGKFLKMIGVAVDFVFFTVKQAVEKMVNNYRLRKIKVQRSHIMDMVLAGQNEKWMVKRMAELNHEEKMLTNENYRAVVKRAEALNAARWKK